MRQVDLGKVRIKTIETAKVLLIDGSPDCGTITPLFALNIILRDQQVDGCICGASGQVARPFGDHSNDSAVQVMIQNLRSTSYCKEEVLKPKVCVNATDD